MGGDGGANNNHDSTKEQIFENIRLHKEVLQSVKMQPWSMRRKLRLVRQVSVKVMNLSNASCLNFRFYFVYRPGSISHAMKVHYRNDSQ